jgi:hypothetical protein
MPSSVKSTSSIREQYGPQKTAGRKFDHAFWQAQGPEAIFSAATDLIQDYFVLKHGHAHLPMERAMESYHRK